ncbi:MAG: DUF2182 domain-containing protein [Actinobacteria bacterium]|nr:DUF2182 domain-containing protein [Actinomycetota bacterium]
MGTEESGTRNRTTIGWILFLSVAAVAWVVAFQQADAMSMGMMVPIHLFIISWIVMMAAMMLPSVAPVALMWARSIKSSTRGAARLVRILLFVSGYLLVWGAFGLLAYAGSMEMTALSKILPNGSRWLVAGLFVLAGIYQLTPLKDVCLKHCRSPMSQLLSYAALKGPVRDLRVGIYHGLYCVGCCWGLMLVLLGLGVMNLAAAAALAIVIFAEKVLPWGEGISKAFGVLLIGLGTLTPFVS